MRPELTDWHGTLATGRVDGDVVVLDQVVRQLGTTSRVFQAVTTDGARWWVKALNNPGGARACITEWVVGRAGELIAAPVCEVSPLEVPVELDGEPYCNECLLEAGTSAVASRDVPSGVELRDLIHRQKDDNPRRHAGLFALHDWCWGQDPQWLYEGEADQRTYSHDHGWYLPGGAEWRTDRLRAAVDVPHEARWSSEGLDREALDEYADRLDGLTRDEIRGILAETPPHWPVTVTELETIGWFLERRAPQVASRLRRRAMSAEGS